MVEIVRIISNSFIYLISHPACERAANPVWLARYRSSLEQGLGASNMCTFCAPQELGEQAMSLWIFSKLFPLGTIGHPG